MNYKENRLDFERRERIGFVEAIWGEHKTPKQIIEILSKFEAAGQFALVTRVDLPKSEKILRRFKAAKYHQEACCISFGSHPKVDESRGKVIILSGGTSDLPVAAEAELALRVHGVQADTLFDVGVAGLHRVLNNLERIQKADIVIACAGMEGALPTVLGGLIPQPIIGVPVSVGYGVSSDGRVAMECMLASCAPGLMVVNIDNGYGAAMAALRIIRLKSKG